MSGSVANEILETIARWQSLQIQSGDTLRQALAVARIEGYQFADTAITEILKQRGEYDETAIDALIREKRKSRQAA
jgi:hypothetical protein